MLAQLEEAGVVRIDSTDGSKRTIAVHGGFLSVSAERVSILAEFAEQADEIDVEAGPAGSRTAPTRPPTRGNRRSPGRGPPSGGRAN